MNRKCVERAGGHVTHIDMNVASGRAFASGLHSECCDASVIAASVTSAHASALPLASVA
jgi:hypothetical protein